MSTKAAPDWLAELQARFGAVIRTPLDRDTGTLRATSGAYDPVALLDALDGPRAPAAERLAVYNRQYWFRLFTVLQTAYPLTARLLGHWHFNEHAARFLAAHPPRGWDLEQASDGLPAFLVGTLSTRDDRDALLEAAHIDAARRAVFRAPATTPFRPRPEDGPRLLDARLVQSPATAVLVEHWPLMDLARTITTLEGESAIPLPPRLPEPRWWALVREPAGIRGSPRQGRADTIASGPGSESFAVIRHVPLEPREGELFALLGRHTVRDALALLEAACPASDHAGLPDRARRWLARSVELGLWTTPAQIRE